MLFALLPVLGGCQSTNVETGSPPAFTVQLTPVVPENQAPLDGLDGLAIIVDPDGAAQTYPLDVPAAGGTAETPQLAPFTDAVVEVDGQSGGQVVAWGRSAPVSGSEELGGVQLSMLFASVSAPAWLGALAPGLYRPMVGALGDGQFVLAGGASEGSGYDGTVLDVGQDAVYRLSLAPPEADLAFTPVDTLPAYADADDRASHTARFGATMTAIATGIDAGRFLVTGGSTGPGWLAAGDITADATLYDPETGSWDSLGAGASLQVARVEHVAIPLDTGGVVVAGGWVNEGAGLAPATSYEIFDPSVRQFGVPVDDAELGSVDLVGANLGDRGALVCGGAKVVLDAGGATGTYEGSQHCALVGTDLLPRSSNVPPLPSPLVGSAMIALPDGRTLLTGGAIAEGERGLDEALSATNRAWVLADGGMTWSSLSPMRLSRAGHAMALLPDGRVVIAGGAASWGLTAIPEDENACVEIFDPKQNVFETVDDCDAQTEQGSLRTRAWKPQVAVDPLYGVLLVGGALAGRDGPVASPQVTLLLPPPPTNP